MYRQSFTQGEEPKKKPRENLLENLAVPKGKGEIGGGCRVSCKKKKRWREKIALEMEIKLSLCNGKGKPENLEDKEKLHEKQSKHGSRPFLPGRGLGGEEQPTIRMANFVGGLEKGSKGDSKRLKNKESPKLRVGEGLQKPQTEEKGGSKVGINGVG